MTPYDAAFTGLPGPAIWGHRGCSTPTENTILAIDEAQRQGADGVEIDVRCCRSGELVLWHDPSFEALSGDRRPIAAMDLSELRALELPGNAQVATLDEVLARCAEHRLALNIELKRDVPRRRAVIAMTAAALRQHDRSHPVVVSSFDPAMLALFRMRCPALPIALLTEGRLPQLHHLARPLGAVAVHPHFKLVSARAIARWHRKGLRVISWTVNDVAVARRLIAMGIDGLISDQPGTLRQALNTPLSPTSAQPNFIPGHAVAEG